MDEVKRDTVYSGGWLVTVTKRYVTLWSPDGLARLSLNEDEYPTARAALVVLAMTLDGSVS